MFVRIKEFQKSLKFFKIRVNSKIARKENNSKEMQKMNESRDFKKS